MRESFIWDKEAQDLVPAQEFYARKYEGVERGPMLIRDIQPYRSVIDGSQITSRSTHRSHLRSNGCVEIGNEQLKPRAYTPPSMSVTDSIQQAMAMPAEQRQAIVKKVNRRG